MYTIDILARTQTWPMLKIITRKCAHLEVTNLKVTKAPTFETTIFLNLSTSPLRRNGVTWEKSRL